MYGAFEKYLTEAEERQLFKHIKQFSEVTARRDYAWMRVLRYTGIRVSTMAQFTVADALDSIAKGRLIRRNEISKRNKGGHTHLLEVAKKALKDLLKIREEMGYSNRDESQPLVMSRQHGGLKVRSYQTACTQWGKRAGLPVPLTPHVFRHTLGKRIVAKSSSAEPRNIVQSQLGHADLSTTAIYTMPDREQVRRAMEEAV